jgi:GTPase SAR1 family protein
MSHIVIVIGGPGAGKSSLCRALAERSSRRAMHIEVDAIRLSMVKGFAFPDPLDPEGEWAEQFRLARRTVEFMAKDYASHDVDCFIDDATIPANFREQYGSLFDDPRTTAVFVYPGQSAQIERMRKRNGQFDEQLIEAISQPFFVPLMEALDTTGWVDLRDPLASVDDNVTTVMAAIERNTEAPSPAG